MKKNELIQSLKIVILGLIFGFGVTLVSAQLNPARPITPPAPTATPPPTGNNIPGPINIGPRDQIKTGGFGVNGFLVDPGDAQFQDRVILNHLTAPAVGQETPICLGGDKRIKNCD